MSTLPSTSTIPNMLALSAQRYGSRVAIEEEGLTLTYAELHRQTLQAARALVAMGIQAGDRVAIWASNVHEWIVAAVGAQAAGAILVPISTRMKGAEVVDILEQSGARVLFCIGEFLGNYYPDMLDGASVKSLDFVVVLRKAHAGAFDWQSFMAQAEKVPQEVVDERIRALGSDSISDILFTSGTTGRPKGVMTAHGQNLRAFECWSGVLGMCEDDRYLIVNPFFHTSGYKAGWLPAVIRGATILPEAVFDADVLLRRVAEERISFLLGPPTLFFTMLGAPRLRDYDISSLRVAVTGAATVPPVLVERMRKELGFKTVVTAYGLTEACGFATICDADDDAETIANTCGKAIPGVEVRCAGPDGKPVAAGSEGEVLVRGFNVMRGYFNNEQATRETIDAEGWLHTGDVGILDARGYLRITDRLKDMYIVGGFNCYPAEIERLASTHPAVAQIAVVGVPDERMGEVGRAFVVLKPGMTITSADFIAWCRSAMTNYKVPRYVDFMEVLPTNASGKVAKNELRTLPVVSGD